MENAENQEALIVDTKVSDAVLFASDTQPGTPIEDDSKGDDQDIVKLTKAEHEEFKTSAKRLSDTQKKLHEVTADIKALRETAQQPKQPNEPPLSEKLLAAYAEDATVENLRAYQQQLQKETVSQVMGELNSPERKQADEIKRQRERYISDHPDDNVDELYAKGAGNWTYEDIIMLGKVQEAGGWKKFAKLGDDDRPRIPGRPDTAKGNQQPHPTGTPKEIDPNFSLDKLRERYGFKQ